MSNPTVMLPPLPPGVPPPADNPLLNGGPMPGNVSVDQASSMIARAAPVTIPMIEDRGEIIVDLPAGWISPDGVLIDKATVRELNGFDEEKLAKTNAFINPAEYVTELLCLGVTKLGDAAPTKDIIRHLLLGDRDALTIGVRKATYGDEIKYTLDCPTCEKSELIVNLSEDVPTVKLDDPLTRRFTIQLKHGSCDLQLINGATQEAFSSALGKKTRAEIDTLMLTKSLVSVNGRAVDDIVIKSLPSADRKTLLDFLAEHQPGPQMTGIIGNCAFCGKEYPIAITLSDMFRL